MDFILSFVGMIFVMGIFISLVVICGTLQAEEEAKRRQTARDQLKRSGAKGSGDEA